MPEAIALDVKKFLSSMRLGELKGAPTPMVTDQLQKVVEDVSNEERFLSGLAALVFNVEPSGGKFEKGKIQEVCGQIDKLVAAQLNEILHDPKF